MKEAEILVIIPHYNNPLGLKESLLSIDETIPIDIIVVDDGSQTERIDLESFAGFLSNSITVNFTFLEQNQGIEHAINCGIAYAKDKNHEFIARLDCGDICSPNRFKIQHEYLIENSTIGLIGSFVSFFDKNGNHLYHVELPTDNRTIRKKMFLNAMFIHPTIMFRKEVLKKVVRYPTVFDAAEDYAFFFEVMKHYEVANIDKVLVKCELNPNGISVTKRKKQVLSRIQLILKNFYFGWHPIYGLFRNILLFIIPYRIILMLKKFNGSKTQSTL